MSARRQILTIVLLIVVVVSFGGWLSNVVGSKDTDYYDQLRMNYVLFTRVFDTIRERYVEEVDPNKVMKAAIEGMIQRLDPYTEYLETEQTSNIQIITDGEYGGVGTRISMRNGWCTVIEQPFDGKPAFRAGIREGDQIIEVDGVSTWNESLDETANRMRGKPGTEVRLKIRREGVEDPLEFRLIRDTIRVEDVNCAVMIDENIGYIRLTRFGRNAGRDVRRAIEDLKREGMKSLVFDLRSNPGGLLQTAVEVADNFIDKGDLIVFTKGRYQSSNNEYRAKQVPVLGDMPLVVLVDRYSASASEIVAGAVQDLDRGVVVGNTTFGKGLVQQVEELPPNAVLKMTFAEYFIPSGRLIQNQDIYPTGPRSVFSENAELRKENEDDKREYKTSSGRIVYGGGGVVPDITVTPDTLNSLEFALLSQSMFFNFAVRYVQDNENLPADLKVGEEIMAEFRTFLKDKEFTYDIEGEAELSQFEEAAKERGLYNDEVASHLAEIKRIIDKDKLADFEDSKEVIGWSLERELVSKLHGTAAGIKAVLDDDEVVQKAVELLTDNEQYWAVLGKKGEVGN